MAHDPGVPIGPVLRRFRKERGLTIEQAAVRARLSTVYYGDIERGKENPTVNAINRILAALNRGWAEFGSAVEGLSSPHTAEVDVPTKH